MFDCKQGYHQIGVREEDKWLTAFVCDCGLFEFNRAPFGLKSSGHSFVRPLPVFANILHPVRECADSFVDDIAVHSNQWRELLVHLTRFLQAVKNAGITLNLKKCLCSENQVKFCGEILGSGRRYADQKR